MKTLKLHLACAKRRNEKTVLKHIFISSDEVVVSNGKILIAAPKDYIFEEDLDVNFKYILIDDWKKGFTEKANSFEYKAGEMSVYSKKRLLVHKFRFWSEEEIGYFPHYKEILPKEENNVSLREVVFPAATLNILTSIFKGYELKFKFYNSGVVVFRVFRFSEYTGIHGIIMALTKDVWS